MPPKDAKKGSDKKPSTAGGAVNQNWETGLIKAEFEEDSWRPCVSVVVGRGPEEEELVQALALAVQQPQRKLFSLLTCDDALAKIHELGNPKAKKPDDAPMFYQVTEPAKLLLDAREEIPCDLMAKILKFHLLLIKASDQQRLDTNQAEGDKAAVPNKKGKGPPTPLIPPKEKKTKLKRRGEVEPPTFKDDEPEWGPQRYILLLGFYQPHLIAGLDAIGVHVSNVIKLRLERGRNIEGQQDRDSCEGNEQRLGDSPVLDAEAVHARKLDRFWSGLRPVLDSGPPDSKLHDVVQLSYTVPDFMLDFHAQDPKTVLELGSQIFDGVASLIYDCLNVRRQYQQYRNNLKLIDVPVLGLYPEPVEVVPAVPTTPLSKKKSVHEEVATDQKTRLPPLSVDVDMCYYNSLLDLVPPEACSAPLILHCMLEQVVVSAEQSLSTLPHVTEESKPVSGPWLDHQLVSYMLQRFLPLIHTEEERHCLLNNLLTTVQNEEDKKRLVAKFGTSETEKKTKQPLVIRHHDERALRFRDIGVVRDFDPAEVESSMMRQTPVWELIESVAQQKDRKSCWMSIKQQLQHYCTDDNVPWPEVERFFHLSVFEAMPLTRVDQQGLLLGTSDPAQQQPVIPWDDPLSFAKQQLRNMWNEGPTFLTEEPGNREECSGRVCSHLDLSDVQSCRLRSLLHWHYAEHHSAAVLPQVLQSASEEYRCMDTIRGSHNNILYIFCHNPMSPHRQAKEFWDVALHTNVKFRNYFEHVAETISNWTREEELKRVLMQDRNNSQKFDSPNDEKTVCSAKEEDSVAAFIRKDSLKAWKLEQERQKEEVMAKVSKKEDLPKIEQQKKQERSSDSKKQKTSSGDKKSRPGTAGSSAKPPAESAVTTAPPADESKEVHQAEETFNGFTGYSMDGKLIHVSGCLQHLFPSDGGHITVENVSFVQGSSQLKVAVKKDGHHFYTHINQVVVEPAKHPSQTQRNKNTEPEKDCRVTAPVEIKTVKQGSLSAVLDNRIRLSYSFYGPAGEYKVISQETKDKIPETSILNPIPSSSSTRQSKAENVESVSSKTQATFSQIRPPESQGCEGQPAVRSSPFNSLSLSVPSGLLLQFLREDTQGEEKGILVRQSFPLHAREKARHLQDASFSKELSRVITSQGAVIRYMRDGATEVLFADGSVSFSQDSGPVWVSDSEVQEEISNQDSEESKEEQSSQKGAEDHRGCWLTTTPCGDRICTVGTTHTHIPTKSLLTFKATDPVTHQVMLNREDLVVCVQNPDGCVRAEHADGTRITSLFQERPLTANTHCSLHAGAQPGSVTLESASQHASVAEDINVKDTCLNGEISRNSAGNTCDREGTVCDCKTLNECGCMCDEKEHPKSSMDKNGEQGVFAEETVTQNVETNVCESDKESTSAKERKVLVEKEGCATVVMYPERQTAHIFLADGTLITGNSQGEYEVFPSSAGLLHIRSDGTCIYSSDPLATPSPKGSTATEQPGMYTMSHADKVACEITDPDGNHFQVMEDGQISVLNLSPAPSTHEQIEEDLVEEEEDRETDTPRVKIRKQCPRLFLVHEDGSGTELLNSQTVEELLYQAYSDPTIALLKEQLPDTQDEFGITILKPGHQSVWSQWLLKKQNTDITPPNLRNRSWHDFPAVEKNPGPPFVTDVRRDLSLRTRSGGAAVQHQPVRSCPKVLELRELYQHRPFTTPLKNTIDSRLKEYIESLMEREQRSQEVKVKDPRSEESSRASDLINLILSFPGEDDASHAIDRRISEDVASLYSQGISAQTEQSDISEDVATAASDSLETLKSCAKEKDSKWPERLAQYRPELCEEKIHREALRKKSIVPFFHPENLPLYESLLWQKIPDMRALSMDLPPFPKSDSTEGFLKDAPQEETLRPLNPTPSQSASHSAGSSRVAKKRPTNPTPQSAGESSWKGSSRQCKSPQLDVTGRPRQTTDRLPSSILSSKPSRVPNAPFLTAEGQTVSPSDAIVRGFQLLPSSVDFGTLKEGTSSTVTVVMKNVGVDRCRFHVKQPPPATGLRVIYSPGPVAAGFQVELQVQLFAVCAVQAGEVEPKKLISQEIIIHTEKDMLHLPVTATILPERLYEIWIKDHPRHIKRTAPSSSRLPAGQQSYSKHRT